jgi:hypothetical protein
MTNTVKFNKHHVAANGIKARVSYSLDNRRDGRKCVTLYAKDYSRELGQIFPDAYENNTDSQTDYFEKGTVRLFEDHAHYATARARAEALDAARRAR